MKQLLIVSILSMGVTMPLWADSHMAVNNDSAPAVENSTSKAAMPTYNWQNLSDEQKQALRNKAKAAWQNLDDAAKARIKQHIQKTKKWAQMSDEEKQQALDDAKAALAKIPPYERKKLYRQCSRGANTKGQNGKQQSPQSKTKQRNFWKVIKQLPSSERQKIIQTETPEA